VLGLLRLASGATTGAIIPLAMAYLGDVVPYENRQTVLARFLSGQILGVVGDGVRRLGLISPSPEPHWVGTPIRLPALLPTIRMRRTVPGGSGAVKPTAA